MCLWIFVQYSILLCPKLVEDNTGEAHSAADMLRLWEWSGYLACKWLVRTSGES